MQNIDFKEEYSKKVYKLFELGYEFLTENDELDYKKFGFNEEDIEELIRLSLDTRYLISNYGFTEEQEETLYFAGVHAINVLTELKAVEAIEPLIDRMVFENGENDYVSESLVAFFGDIGEATIPYLKILLLITEEERDLLSVFDAFERMMKNNSKLEEKIEEVLIAYIAKENHEPTNLASAISLLLDRTQDKHIELIRETFNTKEVDFNWRGDLEDIEIDLGLRKERETERPKNELQKLIEAYEMEDKYEPLLPIEVEPKIGRNDPCPCGSGKKYKKCCINK